MEDAEAVHEPEGVYQFEPLSGKVIAAALEVHKKLGPGFREELYENALCVEFKRRGLDYARQVPVPVYYEGILVGEHLLDLVVENSLVLELKGVATLLEVHYAQLQGYLRAADKRVGLLMNFHSQPLTIKRMVNKHSG
jgi:GxxExxY protein